MEIDYIYIDENGLTVTRLKPQKTVEEYRAHTGGLFDDDLIESIDDLTGLERQGQPRNGIRHNRTRRSLLCDHPPVWAIRSRYRVFRIPQGCCKMGESGQRLPRRNLNQQTLPYGGARI
jgi:hypothetical protein